MFCSNEWATRNLGPLHFTSNYTLYNYYVTNKETLTLTHTVDITGQWREKRSTWFSNRCMYFFSVLVMCHRPTGQNTCGRGFRKSYTLEQTHFCELYIPFKETALYCSHFSILTTQVITFRDLKHGMKKLKWSLFVSLVDISGPND